MRTFLKVRKKSGKPEFEEGEKLTPRQYIRRKRRREPPDPKTVKRRIRVVGICLAVFLAICMVVFYRPHSLNGWVQQDQDYTVWYTFTDGSGSSDVGSSMKEYKLKAGSEELKELDSILSDYSYHGSLTSMFLRGNLRRNAGYWIQIFNQKGKDLITGGRHNIILDDSIYAVGYPWSHSSSELADELQIFLNSLTPEK